MDFCQILSGAARTQLAHELLDLVGMADHASKLPSAISGGRQQRVAVVRALANDPPLLTADEPTGNLDSHTAESVFALFRQLAAAGKTLVMVTHDRDLAARTDRVLELDDGALVSDHRP